MTQSLRGALIGFGTIAEGHLAGYVRQHELTIVAVVDCCAARRNRARAAMPYAQVFASLSDVPPSLMLDFVDICTPPSVHLAYVCEALSNNLHVLCEKPLLADYADVPQLRDALADSHGRLYPSHNYKFAPAILALRAASRTAPGLGSDIIGHFRTVRTGHARGVREWQEHWRRDPTIAGGGILRDHGPHSIYLATHIIGAAPVAVSCTIRHPTDGPWTSTEDTAAVALRFEMAHVQIDLTWAGTSRHTSFAFRGSNGVLRLLGDDLESTLGGASQSTTFPSEFDDPRHGPWFEALLGDFAKRVRTECDNEDLLAEAFTTLEVIDAAYKSASNNGTEIAIAPHSPTHVSRQQARRGSLPTH